MRGYTQHTQKENSVLFWSVQIWLFVIRQDFHSAI